MTSIFGVLNDIEHGNIVLPAIQRSFVWSETQTERLLDSVMRGYPIGIALLWDTHEDIQFRKFTSDYQEDAPLVYTDNPEHRRVKLVLDGQQRLQSLFIALSGTRDGKRLYLDLLSGRLTDDVSDERFIFDFLNDADARALQDEARSEAAKEAEQRDDGFPWYPFRVDQLFAMGHVERRALVKSLASDLDLPDDDVLQVEDNLATLNDVLTKDPNILKISTIDENLPPDSPARKSEADVLEIFVRVNREGTSLSRSDLIFSMLKLNWKEAAESLPEFVRSVNAGNSFGIDADFVVRCLFVVSDLGSRLNLDLLRRKSNVERLRENFPVCCDAIRSTVDFLVSECRVQSGSLLGSTDTMVPFVYYFARLPKHEVPNAQVAALRTSIYACALARPFSRYADSRIGAFVRSSLKPLLDAGDLTFPRDATLQEVRRWESITGLEDLAQKNTALTLHRVQGVSGVKFQYQGNAPEVDHIFPRAELRRKGVAEEDINAFANFWILARGKNRNKSDKPPKQYFKDVDKRWLERALIDPSMLDYRRYQTFLKSRKAKMLQSLSRKTGLAPDVTAL
ncbi:MAG: DUF262 domain-containing protein [Actinomycetota bacterium]|nr:DUF262 domain-containing protein [Actinomycetota bacterium]